MRRRNHLVLELTAKFHGSEIPGPSTVSRRGSEELADVDDADRSVFGRFQVPRDENLKEPFRELLSSDVGSGERTDPDNKARVVRLAAKLGAYVGMW